MFFGLKPVDDHPCCKMQAIIEHFFRESRDRDVFSLELFPDWFHASVHITDPPNPGKMTLGDRFKLVHSRLHSGGNDRNVRAAVCEQVLLTNRIRDLCDGVVPVPTGVIDWDSTLGTSISKLMDALYDALDLAVFRRAGNQERPTQQLYREFVTKNGYVCPFCGICRYKNRLGTSREEFDHYLNIARYPLAGANMENLVPTCGICNKDYKKFKDVLEVGVAFYPYGDIPEISVDIDCVSYPDTSNLTDSGNWSVDLTAGHAADVVTPKLANWDRVYEIKTRLEQEIQEFFEDWMLEVGDGVNASVDADGFRNLIANAKVQAEERDERRMVPGQIIRAAFYAFMLERAEQAFVESYQRAFNRRVAGAVGLGT